METLFVGQNCIELNSVDSTNTFLLNYCSSNTVLEGTVVVAHEQTKGRGQRGNTWYSEADKSLCMSVVLMPKTSVKHQFLLNKCISLAICDALSEIHINAHIKWPNDIFVQNKKIAGILIENTIRGQILNQSIIGIGINVNNQINSLISAVSIKQLLKRKVDLKILISILCKHIEFYYLGFKNNTIKVDRMYQNRLYGLNQVVNFEKDGVEFMAKILGVDDFGRLILEKEGCQLHFGVGELSFKI